MIISTVPYGFLKKLCMAGWLAGRPAAPARSRPPPHLHAPVRIPRVACKHCHVFSWWSRQYSAAMTGSNLKNTTELHFCSSDSQCSSESQPAENAVLCLHLPGSNLYRPSVMLFKFGWDRPYSQIVTCKWFRWLWVFCATPSYSGTSGWRLQQFPW